VINRILKNTGSNVLVLIVKLVITFVMTPVFIHALGNHDYGVWEIVISVVGYMGLLDLGMKPAITRYVAKFNAENDRKKLNELYTTSFVFMCGVGVVLAVFFVVWGVFWPEILSDENNRDTRYIVLLVIIGLQLLITFPGYVAESYLEGFQQYTIKNNIILINSIVGSFLLYIYINPGNALILLALINALGISIKYVIYFLLLGTKKYGGYKHSLTSYSYSLLSEILRFGGKSFIQGVGYQIESSAAPIVIGVILGPAYVVFYVIPASLAKYLQTLGWTLTHAFLPVFSDIHGRNDHELARKTYIEYSRYVLALLLPLAIGVFYLGKEFITFWVGEEYAINSEIILQLIVVYYMLPFINPFSTRYLTATGNHGILAVIYPIVAFINLLLSVAFVNWLGVVGVAYAALIPLTISVPVILILVCRYLELNIFSYLKHVVLGLLFPSLIMAVFLNFYKEAYLIENYFDLFFSGAVALCLYMGVFYLFVLSRNEKEVLTLLLSKKLVFLKK